MSGELITRDGQAQYGSLLMGPGTPYRIAPGGLRGWDDTPPLDIADVPKPGADGMWPGSIYAGERTVELDLNIYVSQASLYGPAVAALKAAAVPYGPEQPLVIRLGGQTLQVGARCTGRVVGADGYALGADHALLRWTATDPRLYSAILSSASTPPPISGGGITWPVTWPLTWPAGTSGGTVTVANAGNWPTPPLITVRGPLTTPAVYRLDTGDVIELATTLVASDVVVIDPLADTLTLNGAPAKDKLTDRSAAVGTFLMPPGATGLALRAVVTDPSASMTATWRSAYL